MCYQVLEAGAGGGARWVHRHRARAYLRGGHALRVGGLVVRRSGAHSLLLLLVTRSPALHFHFRP